MPKPSVATLSQGLTGVIDVPGDKSISHRSLILSSLATGHSTVRGLLEGEDVLATAAAMRQLGATVTQKKEIWHIDGVGVSGLKEPDNIIDLGNSGTSIRLIMGLVSALPITCFFTGDSSLRKRPMQRVITPLEQCGASAISCQNSGKLPLAMIGSKAARPINYILPVASAQVKSAILLAGLNTPGTTTVIEPKATRDHTENMLSAMGANIQSETTSQGTKITLQGHPSLTPQDWHVPADPSSAAFPIVAALITENSDITVKNICMNPLRAGLYQALQKMGANLDIHNKRTQGGEDIADIRARSSQLNAITTAPEDAPSMIDEFPILAIAASFAEGTSVLQGLEELKVKESNRLEAIHNGLSLCGVQCKIDGDTLKITGKTHSKAPTAAITTHLDHRIAMSFLIFGLASGHDVTIDDATVIDTSFPGFIPLMNSLGATIKETACG